MNHPRPRPNGPKGLQGRRAPEGGWSRRRCALRPSGASGGLRILHAGASTSGERVAPNGRTQGESGAAIAAELFVSESTVKTHVGRVLAKLGLRDRVQAVIVAYESGLVRAEPT